MAKTKVLTPQELYNQRKQREEREKLAYLPPGLINHGNTCFMNSVLQGLIATRLLSDLVHFNSIPPEIQGASSTYIASRRSPQLTNGHNLGGIYDQPWVNTMPIGDTFLSVMYKSWDIQANRRREVLSPKNLLGTLGQKYDQYLDFAQQDAHEFLRILLDAMRMEEQDIIKKRQPPAPNHQKKRRRTTVTAANFNNTKNSDTATSVLTSTPSGGSAPAPQDRSDLDPLMSFVDMIFGGKLTSILVCQKCKHVSQSYEDFNDISLSIKPEDYFFGRGSNVHGRKRDRLKKLAKKLTTFPGSGGGGSHATQSPNLNIKSTTESAYPVAVSSLEVQRSSSVPPSPSRLRPGDGNAHMDGEDDGHSGLVSRRKSLDLVETGIGGAMSRVDLGVETSPSSLEAESDIEGVGRAALEVPPPSEVLSGLEPPEQGALENPGKEDRHKEDENIMKSDNSHVHFVSPEESYTEPTEQAKVKNNDKKEDVGWAKLGRRLSTMTAGLGRSKDKDKMRDKERDRKRWSMDRSGLGLAVKDKVEATGSADGSMEKSISDSVVSEETTGLDTQFEKSLISSEGEGTIRRSRAMSVAAMGSKEAAFANLTSEHVTDPRPFALRASSSSSASASTTVHNIFRPLPRAFSSLATPTLNTPTTASTPQPQNPHLTAPSGALHLPNTSSPSFPNVQRSRSPKPPKPTAAESEYLRKILADVSSSASGLNSPFSFFKPPGLKSGAHPFSASASGLTSSNGHGGGTGMWLGLNHFSGIEECLRLFTAVEVLDGENMVGCRRCWKIANGVLDVKNSTRQEDEDSDQEQEEAEGEEEGDSRRHETQTGENGLINRDLVLVNEDGLKKPRPILEALSIANSNTAIHIPTSMSTPTVSFYTLPNSSDSGSILSLPTEATSVLDSNEDSSLVGFSPKESGEDTNPLRGAGPGGMPIPIISTTSPLDTPLDPRTSFARAQRLAVSAKEGVVESSVMDGAEDNGQGRSNSSSSISALLSTRVTPPLALSGYNASGSKDSLLIPKMPMHQRRRTYNSSTSPSASTTDNESSDDDESDTSVGTSVSGESHTSTSVTNRIPSNSSIPQPNSQFQQQQQQQAQVAAQQPSSSTSTQPIKPREKKPKPVIMCPAYKRYLISLPPPVLVIHLKRFQQTSKIPLISFSHGLKKLDDYVSFPEYLDLMPFLAPKKEDYGLGKKKKRGMVKTKEERCTYRLYAVVVHIGNMLGGHYIAYTALPSVHSAISSDAIPGSSHPTPEEARPTNVKPESTEHSKPTSKSASDERQWAFISDTAVRLTTLEEVLHAKAYICMYERC